MRPELVAIGASAGGISALQKILLGLGSKIRAPCVVVLHFPETARAQFSLSFGRFTPHTICEIEDKMPLRKETVYFAPPGYHVLVEKENCFSLSVDEPVHYSRPSIDVFFESAAWAFGSHVVGILLTGANRDGARGLCEIHKRGGVTIVEDPATAAVPTMPNAALKLFKPDFVVPVQTIPVILNDLAGPKIQLEVGDEIKSFNR